MAGLTKGQYWAAAQGSTQSRASTLFTEQEKHFVYSLVYSCMFIVVFIAKSKNVFL